MCNRIEELGRLFAMLRKTSVTSGRRTMTSIADATVPPAVSAIGSRR